MFRSSQLGQKQLGQSQLGQVGEVDTGDQIELSGIASAEALGTPLIQGYITPTAIGSGEAFGTFSLSTEKITLEGIPSAEALGTISLVQNIELAGIASAEALGTPLIEYTITLSGIASAQAVGALSLDTGIGLTGIVSAEALGLLTFLDGDKDFRLFINSVDRTSYLRADTFRVSMQLSSNWTAAMQLIDPAGTYRPSNGQRCEFWWKGTLMFAGPIQSVSEQFYSSTSLMVNDVELMDWSQILTRRVINREYRFEDGFTTLTSILQDLIDNYLAVEGITLGTISTSVTMVYGDAFDFKLKGAQVCIGELAEFFQVDWKVNQYGILSMSTFTSVAAPWTLSDDDGNIPVDTPRVTRDLNGYRNRQFVRSDTVAVAFNSETFIGDGTTRDFTLTQPVARSTAGEANPQVFVDGSEYICIRRSEISGFNPADASVAPYTGPEWWHWDDLNEPSPGGVHPGRIVSMWYTFTPPGIGDVVRIDYPVGSEAGANYIQDTAEIAARQAIEGGSGLYESLDDFAAVPAGGTNAALSAGLLDRFGRENVKLQFSTFRDGLEPGMFINATGLTQPLVGESLLIESVDAASESGSMFGKSTQTRNNQTGPHLRYNVVASNARARKVGAATRFEEINRKLQRAAKTPKTYSWSILGNLALETIPLINSVFEDASLREATLTLGTGPTGADVKINILYDGVTVFDAVRRLVYQAGAGNGVAHFQSVFNPSPFRILRGGQLSISVEQVGSGTAGANAVIHLFTM